MAILHRVVVAQPAVGEPQAIEREPAAFAVAPVLAALLVAHQRQPQPVDLDRARRNAPRQRAEGVEAHPRDRSEEHTSELQSLMRISYAVFCLKKKQKELNPETT